MFLPLDVIKVSNICRAMANSLARAAAVTSACTRSTQASVLTPVLNASCACLEMLASSPACILLCRAVCSRPDQSDNSQEHNWPVTLAVSLDPDIQHVYSPSHMSPDSRPACAHR